jgi:hypothetical protein
MHLVSLDNSSIRTPRDLCAFTTFGVPGASTTFATGMNDNGEIVGYYYDSNGFDHGCTVNAAGLSAAPRPNPGAPAGYS